MVKFDTREDIEHANLDILLITEVQGLLVGHFLTREYYPEDMIQVLFSIIENYIKDMTNIIQNIEIDITSNVLYITTISNILKGMGEDNPCNKYMKDIEDIRNRRLSQYQTYVKELLDNKFGLEDSETEDSEVKEEPQTDAT